MFDPARDPNITIVIIVVCVCLSWLPIVIAYKLLICTGKRITAFRVARGWVSPPPDPELELQPPREGSGKAPDLMVPARVQAFNENLNNSSASGTVTSSFGSSSDKRGLPSISTNDSSLKPSSGASASINSSMSRGSNGSLGKAVEKAATGALGQKPPVTRNHRANLPPRAAPSVVNENDQQVRGQMSRETMDSLSRVEEGSPAAGQ